MRRTAVSFPVAVAIVAVVIGVGASAFILSNIMTMGSSSTESGSTTAASSTAAVTMETPTVSTSSMQNPMMTTSEMTSSMMSTTEMSTTTASSEMSSSSTTSTMASSMTSTTSMMTTSQAGGESTSVQIVADPVSHSITGTAVSGTCGSATPGAGASYLEVTNSGPGSAQITGISFNYVDMVTESGGPVGTCIVPAGSTVYITLTGAGTDMGSPGEMFSVSVTLSNGAFAFTNGAFS